MRACIVNVFDNHAYALCESLLESGEEVIALDEREVADFNADEEDKWLSVGRNANFMYFSKEQFVGKKRMENVKALFHFSTDNLSRHESKLDEKIIARFVTDLSEVEIYLINPSEEFAKKHKKFQSLKNWHEVLVKGKDHWQDLLGDIIDYLKR